MNSTTFPSTNPYINKYFLLNAFKGENVSENTLLISLVYYHLRMKLAGNIPMVLFNDIWKYTKWCDTGVPGLYNNLPKGVPIVNPGDRYTSPDQLIAYCLTLHMGGDILKLRAIWQWLKDHYLTYDNISRKTNFKRIMQPMAIFTAAYCAGCHWAEFPLACAIWYSVEQDQKHKTTSGIQKSWVIDQTLKLGLFEPGFRIKDYLKVYYGNDGQEDHPINLLLEKM